MLSKSNLICKSFYCTLSLVISSGFFATKISSSQASSINKQKGQLELAQENYNNAEYFLASQTVPVSNHQLLASTVDLVRQYEGFRSYAYIDTSGLPVIGYGQTKINGQTVRIGQSITRAQADAALAQELSHIQRLVLSHVQVELTPHQLGALTSLVYNAGTRVISQSTLSRKLNAGDYEGAAREFTRWNKANQGGRLVAMPGLTKRRIAEQNMFLTPYTSISSK